MKFFIVVCLSSFYLFSACSSTKTNESAGQYVDSSVITNKVKAKFLGDEFIKSLDITVETYKGVVQLSGFVDNDRQKSKANELAKNIAGVKNVINNLEVK